MAAARGNTENREIRGEKAAWREGKRLKTSSFRRERVPSRRAAVKPREMDIIVWLSGAENCSPAIYARARASSLYNRAFGLLFLRFYKSFLSSLLSSPYYTPHTLFRFYYIKRKWNSFSHPIRKVPGLFLHPARSYSAPFTSRSTPSLRVLVSSTIPRVTYKIQSFNLTGMMWGKYPSRILSKTFKARP